MGKLNVAVMRTVGFVVLGIVLVMSGYSLYFVARHFGVPPLFAASMSVCFDGVALYMANGSIQEAKEGQTGTVARLWVLVFVGLSAWLNSLHAIIGRETWLAIPMWAALPIGAMVMYEHLSRKERRKALSRNGRYTPNVLPSVPLSYRILFGVRTYHGLRSLAQKHWDTVMAEATERMPLPGGSRTVRGTVVKSSDQRQHPVQPDPIRSRNQAVGETEAVRTDSLSDPAQSDPIGSEDASADVVPMSEHAPKKHIREWARSNGYQVAAGGVLPHNIIDAYMAAMDDGPSEKEAES